ncbi:MAG: hypothetical protein ACPGJK_09280, partial [Paracoccaceae bacterium]
PDLTIDGIQGRRRNFDQDLLGSWSRFRPFSPLQHLRTTGLRVSAPGRFEYRSVDSMVNPYLMGTTLLAAMDDGIDNSISPGEPEERNIYEAIKEGKEVKKLPMSLGEALSYLEQNEVVRRGMPGEMYRLYHEYKYDEWARFMSTSTDWDNEMYMECLP